MPTFFLPYVFIAAGILAGLIVERIALDRLRRWAARTSWKLDEIVLDSLRGVVLSLMTLLGLHLALPYWRLPPGYSSTLSKAIVALALLAGTLALARFLSEVVVHSAGQYVPVPATTSAFRAVVRVGVLVAVFVGV